MPQALPLRDGAPAAWAFSTSLAVRDACISAGIEPATLTLKWPNDVLLRGAKVAGILVELLTAQPRAASAFGIGINLASAPSVAAYRTAALAVGADAGQVLTDLDGSLHGWLARWNEEGLVPLREAWLDAAHGLGERLTARLPGAEISGIFEGIDADGTLLLRTGAGLHRVTAGDVFFSGRPA
ncbi:BirA family biotin operon repressor/biotin-[acetyl-CoA-carboxylase] ligase [Parvularcula dongshanensis]|uniref:biotin--[biotin carboxyl-carrier protein] ligase n=2 Tax=Parvularcula dongshanensis TaxID=1173995 RepID=A0A840I6L6_9PROT|nr:BirA family biotin operon repressor/biotin-[acetyl-CoA-carboxylase] ligase [Parvularcula dongshanensis]